MNYCPRSIRFARWEWAFAVFAALGSTIATRADVTLASLFTDHAVLQRDRPVPVWGVATPGEKVTVALGQFSAKAEAGADGNWLARFPPMPANAAGADLVVSGKNTVIVRDVVVGDVWLCSGQSNMAFTVKEGRDAAKEIAAADLPLIRHVKIERTQAASPATQVRHTGWKPAKPDTVALFSAVAYFFARGIHQSIGVPIGLINSSVGGTPVEAWMSPESLAENPAFQVVMDRWIEAGQRPGGRKATGPNSLIHEPAKLYNGMIHPLLLFAVRGVLWYQGEGNTTRASEYGALFATMIRDWRARLGQGDVPFFWVQLPGFKAGNALGTNFAVLRDAQTKALTLPATGQAVAIDLGDPDNIHPKNKQDVSHRLALLALNRVYSKPGEDTGPTFAGMTRDGASLRLRLDHAAGLEARNGPVLAFEVAGTDREFHPAAARIDGESLVVSSPAVPAPVTVRYAWRNAPQVNLVNAAGLPMVPFRTDDW